ncbi:MAG: hypothetical protein C0617_14090 [Desulfuromonas sp.]|uniref:type II toxin-antitoxin system RelE family toxin n=1 Tax=Desulfuromonas sp. TaxID=892 RepID=UPI000CBFFD0A|nr:hypothetical protein [Desulfuromonas sp.]PLX82257.1 MAG: hypothetical protein C0617_14090 [Desulfuromonas sp.]
MAWTVEVSDYAERQLRKLDSPVQKRLLDWLDERIEGCKTSWRLALKFSLNSSATPPAPLSCLLKLAGHFPKNSI